MEILASSFLGGRVGTLAENEVFAGGLLLVVLGIVGAYLHWLVQVLWERMLSQFAVSLEIRKEDEAFHWVMKWLAHHTEGRNGRELSLLTTRENDRDRWEGSEAASRPTLHFAPAPGLHFYRYRGRWLSVERTIKENQISGSSHHNGVELHEIIKISTFGRDPQILKDLARESMDFNLGEELGKTLIFQPKYGWGGQWRKLMAVEKRSLASVHFPDGVLEGLLKDVSEFFAMRAWYKRRGIPHRRGLMLYGPPGCGKSSFAIALAGELCLNLCVCSLANTCLDDDDLQEYLRKMPQGSILLLEDIDAAFVNRKKNTEEGAVSKVTFSGLLNALDGAVAFEGSLVLMTTNHREKLDPALTRPGRIDRAVEVCLARHDQIARMFSYFYQPWEKEVELENQDKAQDDAIKLRREIEDERKNVAEKAARFAELIPEERLSMASIQGYLLRYKADPQAAMDHVKEFVAQELVRIEDEAIRSRAEGDGAKETTEGVKENQQMTGDEMSTTAVSASA